MIFSRPRLFPSLLSLVSCLWSLVSGIFILFPASFPCIQTRFSFPASCLSSLVCPKSPFPCKPWIRALFCTFFHLEPLFVDPSALGSSRGRTMCSNSLATHSSLDGSLQGNARRYGCSEESAAERGGASAPSWILLRSCHGGRHSQRRR